MYEIKENSSYTGLEVAIIGMAGRFPGAKNVDEFWNNLKKGAESITFFTPQELEQAEVDPKLLENPNYVNSNGGILEDKFYFDANFFDYLPTEARLMNPHIRQFHECAWEALENAGYDPYTYKGSIGFYAGACPSFDWELGHLLSGKNDGISGFERLQLMNNYFLCTRVAYRLNLKGPAIFVQSACSTSLVAIDTASRSLLTGGCDMALTGGISIKPPQKSGYLYQENMIMSSDGHCRAFDAKASGLIGGEGMGAVVLKLLEDALADGDYIHAVIKGFATNNDGNRKVGYPAPSIKGQVEVIRAALQMAEVEPETITYVETHGTGTALGDPVEMQSLKSAFNTSKKGFCAIGAVKTNVGHLDSAAGVTGLIKTIMAIKNKKIPPTLHFNRPNTNLDIIDSPFYINTQLSEWSTNGSPLRAGVSSFGVGGTNAHIILEEWPLNRDVSAPVDQPVSEQGTKKVVLPPPREHLILLSAKTPSALDKMKERLVNHFKKNPGISLADAAYTLQVGRRAFKHRLICQCAAITEALHALSLTGSADSPGVRTSVLKADEKTGQVMTNLEKHTLIEIGQLWLQGEKIDWNCLHNGEKRYRLPLPTYPFEGQHYPLNVDLNKRGTWMPAANSRLIKRENISEWFYIPSWKRSQQKPGNGSREPDPLCALVFLDESGIGVQMAEKWENKGWDIVRVNAGDRFTRESRQEYKINPRQGSDYKALLKEIHSSGKHPGMIVHLWGVTGENPGLPAGETFEKAQYMGLYSLIYLAGALGSYQFGNELQVRVVTDLMQEVTGDEPLQPEKSTVLAVLKCIPQEYPFIVCRSIDIRLPEPGSSQEHRLIRQLMEECQSNSIDTVVAYRNNHRWLQFFEPVSLEQPGDDLSPLREGGVYLITGGLGNIGLALAKMLARRVKANLILTSRGAIPTKDKWNQWLETHQKDDKTSRKIRKIQEIETLGAKVLPFSVDIADLPQMKEVMSRAESQLGPINGVIHAAGDLGESISVLIDQLTESLCQQQFHPKVTGLLVLEKLFKDKDLDFCLLTSSLVSILGGLGFTAYTAGNLFMDAFVHRFNRKSKQPWISMNTAEWEFNEVENPENLEGEVKVFMKPEEGVETILRILCGFEGSQVAVSPGDLQIRLDRWVKLESLRQEKPSDRHNDSFLQPRPALTNPYTPPGTPEQKAVTAIWHNLFGFGPLGIQDDFFELGGDSLKAITVISSIHKKMNVVIPLKYFYTNATVEKLTEYCLHAQRNVFAPLHPVEKKEYYNISAGQKRLFIVQQMDTSSVAYNIPIQYIFEGELDLIKLEKAFRELIHRHENFRTSFILVGETPYQKIHREIDFEIEHYNIEGTANEPEDEFAPARIIIKDFSRPFELSQPPLIRLGVIKISDSQYIIMNDVHHIISDVISMDLMVREFMQLIESEQTLALNLQYKDYAEWQETLKKCGSLQQQEEYWINQFKEIPSPLNLPTDFARPKVQSFEGKLYNFQLNSDLSMRLKKLASLENASMYVVLLSIYTILMWKLTGQEDIIVGVTPGGRTHADLDQIIGFFVNTLALRNYPQGCKTFKEFLKEAKECTLNALDNQDYQFDDLCEKVLSTRDISRNPLYDVMFTLQNQEVSDLELPGGKFRLFGSGSGAAICDLNLNAHQLPKQLIFSLAYSTRLFKLETILIFIEHFKKIIADILENPGIKLHDIRLSSEKTVEDLSSHLSDDLEEE